MKLFYTTLLIAFGGILYSQHIGSGTVQPFHPGNTECLNNEQRKEIQSILNASRNQLTLAGKLPAPDPEQLVLFNWPLQLRTGLNQYGYHSISAQVDQDPAFPNNLLDYNCGTRTYDTPSGYNHAGTDFFLWPFSWNKMDSMDVEIVSAAAGTIIYKSDGNFDRSCGLNTANWNAVYIQHADGSVAWYGHMKSGSLTPKTNGMTVTQGEYLGTVGSSGNSSGPHLHLEIYDDSNNLVDPFQGICNSMNSVSWWTTQRLYLDRGINHIASNDAPPVFTACSNQDIKNEADQFLDIDTIFLMTYYRFLQLNDVVQITIYQPDNSVWSSWPWTNTWANFNAAYVYFWMIAGSGAQHGQWKFEAVYDNQTYFDYFWIGSLGEEEFNSNNSGKKPMMNIYSMDGRLLKKVSTRSVDPNLLIPEYPQGIYIWNLYEDDQPVSQGKLMKIR